MSEGITVIGRALRRAGFGAACTLSLVLTAAPIALAAQEAEAAPPSITSSSTTAPADTPPEPEAPSFEEAFAAFDEPRIPAPPADAVDITAIEPARQATRSLGNGVASYYGRRFHGRLTANGERFNMRALTAAHKTLPFGTRVRVTNLANGRSVVVRINDRGPFIAGRHIDLSRRAAEEIGMIRSGHTRVKMEILVS